jgi:hypothetical protein
MAKKGRSVAHEEDVKGPDNGVDNEGRIRNEVIEKEETRCQIRAKEQETRMKAKEWR